MTVPSHSICTSRGLPLEDMKPRMTFSDMVYAWAEQFDYLGVYLESHGSKCDDDYIKAAELRSKYGGMIDKATQLNICSNSGQKLDTTAALPGVSLTIGNDKLIISGIDAVYATYILKPFPGLFADKVSEEDVISNLDGPCRQLMLSSRDYDETVNLNTSHQCAIIGGFTLISYCVIRGVIRLQDIVKVTTYETMGVPVVYLIRSGGLYKIGITSNLERRMRELNPDEIVVVEYNPDNRELEKELHALFRDERLPQSEYFKLTADQVRLAIDRIKGHDCETSKIGITKLKTFFAQQETEVAG